jgi:hypothetical protein
MIRTLAALAIVAAAFAAGYGLKARLAQAEIARLEATHAQEREAAARAAADRLAKSDAANRKLQAELTRRETAFNRRLKEAKHEIDSLSTGRECLPGALRLRINAAIAGDDVPASAAATNGSAAAAAADPGGATDREIADWALEAARLYDACRARIDAIREWDEATHGR